MMKFEALVYVNSKNRHLIEDGRAIAIYEIRKAEPDVGYTTDIIELVDLISLKRRPLRRVLKSLSSNEIDDLELHIRYEHYGDQ